MQLRLKMAKFIVAKCIVQFNSQFNSQFNFQFNFSMYNITIIPVLLF